MSEPRPPLHVLDEGAGSPAILFIHGFPSSSRLWAEVIHRLETSHRCVAPDLRGFGRSPEFGAGWRITDHVDDLQRLLGALRLGDFVLVGHSMGGKIAAALAATRPAGLRRLVLLASSPLGPELMSEADRAEALAAYDDPLAAEALVDRITRHPPSGRAREAFIDDGLLASNEAWRWWLEHGSRENLSGQTAKIATSLTVVAGDDDPVLPPAVQDQLALALGAEPPTLMAGAGHLLPIERPDACAALLREACLALASPTLSGVFPAPPPAPGASVSGSA